MRRYARAAAAILLLMLAAMPVSAARHWRNGTWRKADVTRKMVDFGPGSSSFDGGRGSPAGAAMRAMVDVLSYTIETDGLLIELEEVVQIGRRSLDVVVGTPVVFSLEKNSVYVKDADGKERKLRVTKKIATR